MSNENEILNNNDTENTGNTAPSSAAGDNDYEYLLGSDALDSFSEENDDAKSYRKYRTDVRKLNYRGLTSKELEIQKKKNMFSCAFFGGIILIISLSVGAFMIFKSAPIYGYILPIAGLVYSGIQAALIFKSKYGAFDGEVVEKFVTTKNTHCLKVWSEYEKQFCPMVEWYEEGWEEIQPGSKVTIYKVNRQYHAERSIN